jgi:hypothetical protein
LVLAYATTLLPPVGFFWTTVQLVQLLPYRPRSSPFAALFCCLVVITYACSARACALPPRCLLNSMHCLCVR